MAHNHYPADKATLNPVLLARQNRSEKDIKKIIELHEELHKVFDEMEAESVENEERLGNLALVVQQLEFDLQEAWGFPKNANYHSWWFQVPHCICPVLDNWDFVGTEYKHYTVGCPVHKSGKHPEPQYPDFNDDKLKRALFGTTPPGLKK
jgi:hypothetical protein